MADNNRNMSDTMEINSILEEARRGAFSGSGRPAEPRRAARVEADRAVTVAPQPSDDDFVSPQILHQRGTVTFE